MSYDRFFFEYTSALARRSAEQFLPHLVACYEPRSVLDVGCAAGAWLAAWKALGVDDVLGVDGGGVDRARLLVAPDEYLAHDLTTPLDVGRRFDLVQSLEVAEHLPAEVAATYVDSLVRHGDVVLFSAAPKGQGGEHHVNEQDYGYWRDRFHARGYVLVDCLRPRVAALDTIGPWYRYNTFLYVTAERLDELGPALARCVVPPDAPIPDVSPPLYRLRKRLVRLLPLWVADRLARLKARAAVRSLRSRAAADSFDG